MSTLFSILAIAQIILTSSQQSGICINYFIDIYTAIDSDNAGMPGNNPTYYQPQYYTPPPNLPYVAYPMNHCTRNGNDNDASLAAEYAKWKCSQTGGVVSRCQYGADQTCNGNCVQQTVGAAAWDINVQNAFTFGGGHCDSASASVTGQFYMEIGYYKSYRDTSHGCPGTPYVYPEGYLYAATNKFATGVCVKQDPSNTYVMATCDRYNGELSVYSNAGCTTKTQTLISYSTACEYFDNPEGDSNTFRYFRRLEGCYVAGADIQVPSPSPTLIPTKYPTTDPSRAPVTEAPTLSPVTPDPSHTPSVPPTKNPTVPAPTQSPTVRPTDAPITNRPTKSPTDMTADPSEYPTESPTKEPTEESDLQSIEKKVKGFGFIEYAIIGGSVLFLCLCCVVCCWWKKKQLKEIDSKFESRRMKRAAARRQRQMELMRRKQRQQNDGRQLVRQTSPMDGQTATQV